MEALSALEAEQSPTSALLMTVSLRVGSMSISPMVNEIKDTLISELLDTVERVKNELRLRTDKKFEVIAEDANTLKDRLATLESGGITRRSQSWLKKSDLLEKELLT